MNFLCYLLDFSTCIHGSYRDRGATLTEAGGGGGGGGGRLTCDSKWGGGELKTLFLSNSLQFSKTCVCVWGGGGGGRGGAEATNVFCGQLCFRNNHICQHVRGTGIRVSKQGGKAYFRDA